MFDFLGKGMSFPLEPDLETGDIKGVSGKENLKASIRMFLSTIQGERILNEGYGVPRLIFENIDQGTSDIVRSAVFTGLATFEPRIRVTSVEVVRDESIDSSGVRIGIRYTILATDEEDSLVVIPTQITEQF